MRHFPLEPIFWSPGIKIQDGRHNIIWEISKWSEFKLLRGWVSTLYLRACLSSIFYLLLLESATAEPFHRSLWKFNWNFLGTISKDAFFFFAFPFFVFFFFRFSPFLGPFFKKSQNGPNSKIQVFSFRCQTIIQTWGRTSCQT